MLRFCVVTLLATIHSYGQSAAEPPSQTPAHQNSADSTQALIKRHCLACHNDKVKTGGVSLTAVRADAIAPDAELWEKVLRKVRTGEMPPLGAPRPAPAASEGMAQWVESELDRAGVAKPHPGRPAIQRLNRAEYSNAVRDLLDLDLDHSASLPADDSGYGFDNIGDVLTVSPLLMEKYMATARRVSRLAIGTVKTKAAIDKIPARPALTADTGDLPLNVRGGVLIRRHFPLDAEYSILVRVRGNPAPGMPAPKLDVRVDGKRVRLLDVQINPAEEAQDTRNYELRLPLTAGIHHVGAAFLNEYAKLEGGPVARGPFGPPPASPASVDYVTIGGPFNATGPGETPSRNRIFVCRPKPGQAGEPCARRILSTLARRAYRRPVLAADVQPLMKLFASGRKDGGSFDSGIETAVRGVLVSPSFLFRIERDSPKVAPGTNRRVSDLELASRLSFFLWSSIPDDELLKLAQRGTLRPVLAQQVRRMLADPKSKALVENFAGQWLYLRNIPSWRPDPEKFPQFDDSLRYAFQRETELFFEHLIRNDRPVTEFLNAQYSFLNERLANHYGVSGVRGSYFRRVTFTGEERGGIVTHGSILTVTSYPTRTSPVLRGKWILENMLGAPPPPPPPDVPDLADSAAISAKDLRKALEKHRENASCAACHSRLDPLGFALENYDAVGKFRKSEGGADIDASGALPGGATFAGPGGLKSVLAERSDQFVECLSEKLLTYALGRGLEYYDLPAVRKIRRETAKGENRFTALALAVVNSLPFQMRRTSERP